MKRSILVFLKYPAPGRVKTRLASALGDEEAALAYQQLVSRVFEQCKMAGPDRIAIAYDPPDQRGDIQTWLDPWLAAFPGTVEWIPQVEGDLGERLESATEEAFRRIGDTALGVIGTDCVHLDRRIYEKCWTELNGKSDAVFGPTEDGGYYMLGLTKPQPTLFRDIPWSSADTLKSSMESALAAGLRTATLPVRIDIDTVDEWNRIETEVNARRCVFFDRDGVVNESPGPGYVLSVEQFKINPGIAESVRWLKENDWLAILVTSQRGVGKGLMTAEELDRIHHYMQTELQKTGAAFDGIYAYAGTPDCPYPAKPDPGMIFSACESFYIDPRQSWMIGDADRDIQMGIAASLAGTIRIEGEKEITVGADHTLGNTIEIPDTFKKVL